MGTRPELWHRHFKIARLWHSAQPHIPVFGQLMLQQLLSITQTAERLKVRPDYVRQLVAKGRLTFTHGEQLDAMDVERLAKLMDRLRGEGLATLVEITQAQLGEEE